MNSGDIHLRIPKQVALSMISLLAGGLLFSIGSALADGSNATQTVVGSDIIMPYDGYLMVDSAPLTGTRTIKFDLYQDATGGTVAWTETQVVNLYNGRFSVGLGSSSSLTSTILDAEKLYLSMTVVETDSQGNTVEVELSGRQAIEPAPFAAWAANSADFNVAGDANITGNANVDGDVIALGSLSAPSATITGSASVSDTLTTHNFIVTATTELGNGYSQDSTSIKGVDNDGSDSALSIQSAADQILLLDGNEIDAIDGDLFLQNNSSHDVRIKSDLVMDGAIKPGYSSWDGNDTGDGGAAIANDNGTYQALMIVGNDSGGDRRIEMYDDLYVNDALEVKNNASVGGNLTVTGSINGTVSSSCPGTTVASHYSSGSNTRTCVYEMTTARTWPESAARCYSNFNAAELCSYQQIQALTRNGSLTFDGTHRWLSDIVSDDNALYTNRAISSSSDSDIDNFEGDDSQSDNKRAFCCLRITN